MKNILVLALITLPLSLQAEVTSDLTRCLKIENNDNRLDCYDTVASHYKKNQSASIKVSDTLNKAGASNLEQSSTSDSRINISKEDAFGKSNSELSDLESIRSRIQGPFKGWIKGDTLALTNGQKWEVISNNSGYVNLQDPEIVITKGFWGSFKIKVEGLNAQAKVKRIK